jgi:hypothetical protein
MRRLTLIAAEPLSKEKHLMLKYLKEGVLLCTLNGCNYSNAVYISCDEMGYHRVVSDFGNEMCLSTGDLIKRYTIPEEYRELVDLDYPFNTLKERWEAQISLLTAQLENLGGGLG